MGIYITQTFPHEPAAFDELQYFAVSRDVCRRQFRKKGEDFPPVVQRAASQLSDDKRMGKDFFILQRLDEAWNRMVQMIDPDRTVDEDQEDRRLRGAFACGSLPPSRAKRRAASRAINARRAS